MKKAKKIRKYEADGFLFNTFKQLKKYIWYKTSKDTTKICYELEEDVITKKYIFTKKERRLMCEKTFDKDLEEIKKWEEKQLKLFKHENYRDSMGRNYPSYFNLNNCDNYNTLRTKLYDEFKRQQKQSKLNAKDRTNNNVKR